MADDRPRAAERTSRVEPSDAVPVRHPGRWVAVAVLAVLAAMLVNTVFTNDNFRWDVVGRVPVRPAGAQRAAEHTAADRAVDGHRHRAAARARGHAAVAEPGAQRRRPGLHLVVPRHPADRPAAVLELPRRALPATCRWASRSGRSSSSFDTNMLITPVRGVPARPRAERGRLHGRDRPRRASSRSTTARPRRPAALGMTRTQTLRRDRAAAGDAGDHPADRQRDHLDAEDHLAGRRDRLLRAAHLGAADLLDRTSRRSRC